MEVFALTGPSGTGKSHRAIALAHELDADLIIDDGLVIKGTQILAGLSAKRQPTRIGAIKTALFLDKNDAELARSAIVEIGPQRVLILATSTRMAEKIRNNLNLDSFSKVISIEEVASPKEIRKARMLRKQHSKHVIPAPTVEVQKTFPDTLIDPLQVFLRRKSTPEIKSWSEQSVVRPSFTSYGKISVSHSALISIITRAAEEIDGVKKTGRVHITRLEQDVVFDIFPTIIHGYNLKTVSYKVQLAVKKRVEYMTGLSVKAVNVLVKDLSFKSD
ncbi:MAG: hypothetical protein XD78_0516 [Desulfotomaculum sp. 46_296]|nr:MAG: hypothetical protein XD78_0516 [Desulfotomaculum sp. 46_296]HAU31065.1 Asp23/Gls24 family envelope stress response protein [Desulfotomaculum sp.]